ncbi:MAG: hypothetical protein II916_02525, partial [Oscillospiraceae bacterium]|nr:hypothetical protein [Oscillospiraceae bacterium]
SGNLSTAKGSVTYAGLTLTQCLKMETATSISFTAPSAGSLTLVFVEPAATIKVNGTKYTANGDGIITVDVPAGANTVAKADSANLFYMSYAANSGENTQAPASETTTVTTTTVTTTVPTEQPTSEEQPSSNPVAATKYGDVNGDGEINIMDVIALNKFLLGSTSLSDEAKANADVDNNGKVESNDSLNILKYIVELIDTLPIK